MNMKRFMQFLIFYFCLIGCGFLSLIDLTLVITFVCNLTKESFPYKPSFIICDSAIILGIAFAIAVFIAIAEYIDGSGKRKTAELNHRDTANAIKKILKKYKIPKDVIEKLTELKRRDVDFYKPEQPPDPFRKEKDD